MLLFIQSSLNDVAITFYEFLMILIALGGIVSVWIAVNIKIAKIEVGMKKFECETELKLKALESRNNGVSDFLGQRISEFVNDNKEDHNEVKASIAELFKLLRETGKEIAKITPYQHNP